MIDFSLTDAQREVQRTARVFAEREILPRIHELDSTSTYDRSLYEKMGAAGLLGLPIPERYGGAGMDYIAFALLCEEMERADTAFRVILSVHTGLNSLTLLQWGSEEQKQHYLVPQARGEKLATFGLTEPGVGQRRRQPVHHRAARRRPLHPQRQQDLDQPGRYRRPLPRLRHGRQGGRPQGDHRLHRRARLPGLQHRFAPRQARRPRREHRHPDLLRLRGAGRQPGRRGGRGLHHRHERHRPGALHRGGRIGRAGAGAAWTHRSSTRMSGRPSARRSAPPARQADAGQDVRRDRGRAAARLQGRLEEERGRAQHPRDGPGQVVHAPTTRWPRRSTRSRSTAPTATPTSTRSSATCATARDRSSTRERRQIHTLMQADYLLGYRKDKPLRMPQPAHEGEI